MPKSRIHLKSNNASMFESPTIQISTVRLLDEKHADLNNGFTHETAIITVEGVEPVEQYSSVLDAIAGHQRYCSKYRCYNKID